MFETLCAVALDALCFVKLSPLKHWYRRLKGLHACLIPPLFDLLDFEYFCIVLIISFHLVSFVKLAIWADIKTVFLLLHLVVWADLTELLHKRGLNGLSWQRSSTFGWALLGRAIFLFRLMFARLVGDRHFLEVVMHGLWLFELLKGVSHGHLWLFFALLVHWGESWCGALHLYVRWIYRSQHVFIRLLRHLKKLALLTALLLGGKLLLDEAVGCHLLGHHRSAHLVDRARCYVSWVGVSGRFFITLNHLLCSPQLPVLLIAFGISLTEYDRVPACLPDCLIDKQLSLVSSLVLLNSCHQCYQSTTKHVIVH